MYCSISSYCRSCSPLLCRSFLPPPSGLLFGFAFRICLLKENVFLFKTECPQFIYERHVTAILAVCFWKRLFCSSFTVSCILWYPLRGKSISHTYSLVSMAGVLLRNSASLSHRRGCFIVSLLT